jgi:xanthine dehydrogenase YagR molybdenum-binding subunit
MRAANGDLLGWGVAIGLYPGDSVPAKARVRLHRDGSVDVSVGAHEMGQGIRSAIALIVADRLGVDPACVRLTIGDTAEPPQHVTAGAWGTASVGPAVYEACNRVREELLALASTSSNGTSNEAPPISPPISPTAIAQAFDGTGRAFVEATTVRLAPGQSPEAFDRAQQGLVAPAGPEYPDFVCFQSIAHFIEVTIDPSTYQVRVPRAVSVVDCGKVVSARTARSQVLGGLVWGIGACLREVSEVDPRFGGFLNANIAEYQVPVNADIGDYSVEFIDEPDFTFNPLGAKGLGEIVLAGVAPAIANAIYHATGRRFRRLPIRLDDLHTQTPPPA